MLSCMFSLVYSHLKVRIIVDLLCQNEPFISAQGAALPPWSTPCFYRSPKHTNQTLALDTPIHVFTPATVFSSPSMISSVKKKWFKSLGLFLLERKRSAHVSAPSKNLLIYLHRSPVLFYQYACIMDVINQAVTNSYI